jgi:hypothetical protein
MIINMYVYQWQFLSSVSSLSENYSLIHINYFNFIYVGHTFMIQVEIWMMEVKVLLWCSWPNYLSSKCELLWDTKIHSCKVSITNLKFDPTRGLCSRTILECPVKSTFTVWCITWWTTTNEVFEVINKFLWRWKAAYAQWQQNPATGMRCFCWIVCQLLTNLAVDLIPVMSTTKTTV